MVEHVLAEAVLLIIDLERMLPAADPLRFSHVAVDEGGASAVPLAKRVGEARTAEGAGGKMAVSAGKGAREPVDAVVLALQARRLQGSRGEAEAFHPGSDIVRQAKHHGVAEG